MMILKEFLGVPRAKALNHTPRIPCAALYVNRINLPGCYLIDLFERVPIRDLIGSANTNALMRI